MVDVTPEIWALAHELMARELVPRNTTANSTSTSTTTPSRPPIYKAVGIILAICSGLFIGVSFVLKKMGLLKANAKYNEEAGEGYGYLKNAVWWTGMTLMIIGEICNFVAYAFVDAILVTPLGALSVVITTVLSAIFLKERLSFVGKVGCFNCIIGSVIIVMNAPAQSAVADIQEMQHFVIAPGFLSYAGVLIVGCAFIAFWVGPRYGKKSMLVYLSICSLIGGLSVVATQGLGSAVVAQAGGKPQFNQWFLYVLLVFVVATLVTEIIFLNKALNLFNAALVTPTYYVFFTSATIVTSAILFQGFKGTPTGIATVIMGFLQICTGVILLQLSKSAKDVPDAAVFKGDLDQMREVAEQEQPESEPKADAIRGTAALIRRLSVSRRKMEEDEFRRLHQEKMQDQLEPLQENEIVEWDGLRRRKTIIGELEPGQQRPIRRKTLHPPLGMSKFPSEGEREEERVRQDRRERRDTSDSHSFFSSIRQSTSSVMHGRKRGDTDPHNQRSPMHPVALTEINIGSNKMDSPILPGGPGSLEEAEEHIYGLPPGLRKEQNPSPRSKPLPAQPSTSSLRPGSPATNTSNTTRRQFSFTNVFHRKSTPDPSAPDLPHPPPSRAGIGSRGSSYNQSHEQKRAMKNATEEERLGLVKGDSNHALLPSAGLGDSSPPRISSPEETRNPLISTHSSPYAYDPSAASRTRPSVPFNPHRTSPIPSEDDEDNYVDNDNEDNDWQMTSPPHGSSSSNNPPSRSPPRGRPPPVSSSSTQAVRMVVPTPGMSLASTSAPNLHPLPYGFNVGSVSANANASVGGSGIVRTASPEDYDASRRRVEEQRRQGGGTSNSRRGADGGAFV